MTYPLLDGELVYDPNQTVAPYVERMQRYFDARPKLKQAWIEQLDILRDFKTGKLKSLMFPEWSSFLCHIGNTGLDEVVEPGVVRDG